MLVTEVIFFTLFGGRYLSLRGLFDHSLYRPLLLILTSAISNYPSSVVSVLMNHLYTSQKKRISLNVAKFVNVNKIISFNTAK